MKEKEPASGHKVLREAKAGPSVNSGPDPPFANLETLRIVGRPAAIAIVRGVPLWHELGYHVGADDAAPHVLARARDLVPASKRPALSLP